MNSTRSLGRNTVASPAVWAGTPGCHRWISWLPSWMTSRSPKVTVGSAIFSSGNSRAKAGMNRWRIGTGGKPGTMAARHGSLATMVEPRKS